MASYLRYADNHPGTQPDDESAELGRLPGDLNYLYRLTLNEDQHGLRLEVHDLSMRSPGRVELGTPIETLTQADLYAAAASWCDTVAARCERYAAPSATPLTGTLGRNALSNEPIGKPRPYADRAPGAPEFHSEVAGYGSRCCTDP